MFARCWERWYELGAGSQACVRGDNDIRKMLKHQVEVETMEHTAPT